MPHILPATHLLLGGSCENSDSGHFTSLFLLLNGESPFLQITDCFLALRWPRPSTPPAPMVAGVWADYPPHPCSDARALPAAGQDLRTCFSSQATFFLAGDKSGKRLTRPHAALFAARVKAFLHSVASQGIARQTWVGTWHPHPSPPPAPFSVYSPLLSSSVCLYVCLSLISFSPFASHHPFLSLLSLLSLVTHLPQPPELCRPPCALFLARGNLNVVGSARGREDHSPPPETRAPVPWEEGLAFGAKGCGEGVRSRWQRCPIWGRGWRDPSDEHPC